MLTPRFFGFLMIFPALLLLGTWSSILVPIGIGYGAILALLLWLDRRAAGRPDQFRVERRSDSKLSLGVPNRIVIRVQSRARRQIAITARDDAPFMFAGAEEALVNHDLEGGETAELPYWVRPLKRGDYQFGDIHIRWASPLNFYIRQAKIPAAAGVKVYPNLHEIRKYDLLVRRDQLTEMGLKNVRLRGEGTQFESLRDYTTDDPYRNINWKATARRGKPISMDFEPERSQRVMIALDVGRMMRSPIRIDDDQGASWNMSKVDFVINSVLLFSYVATLKGDQVGLLVFADRVQQYLAPQGGHAHFQKLLEVMYALQSETVEPDYGQAFNYLRKQNQKRSLVVIFTDLSGSRASDALIQHVPRLAPRHLPMLVTIRDPALDQEAEHMPSSSDLMYRKAVAEQLIDDRRLLLEHLARRGVITLDVDAQDMTMAVVSHYLHLKARVFL